MDLSRGYTGLQWQKLAPKNPVSHVWASSPTPQLLLLWNLDLLVY